MATNGNGAWRGYWVALTITVMLGSYAFTCLLCDKLATEMICTYKETNAKFDTLKEISNDILHDIDLRLSRIEKKLDIK